MGQPITGTERKTLTLSPASATVDHALAYARQNLGNLVIAALVVIDVVLWLAFLPSRESRPTFTRQMISGMFGSSALILLASSLILATRAPVLEPYFGGLDRMYRWHRQWGIVSLILFLGHLLAHPANPADTGLWRGWMVFAVMAVFVMVAMAPRIPVLRDIIRLPYPMWRMSHRNLGPFLLIGVAGSVLMDSPIRGSLVLSTYVGAAALAGLAACLYKVPLYGLLKRKYNYVVESVRRLNDTILEITLSPEGQQLSFQAGQFLFVSFHGNRLLSEPHPFTITSAPRTSQFRLTVKGSGDYTRYLQTHLRAGTQATVEGSYGRFSYKTGSHRQVWVAGGIGVAPFLSWIGDFGGQPQRDIDFYYCVRRPEEAVYLDEIEQAAARHSHFRRHVVYSQQEGHLTAERIVATSGQVMGRDLYLCGPAAMILALQRQFKKLGVSGRNIHFEEFSLR